MKIYALEITSECNLHCSYCPQPSMQRNKQHMSMELYQQALKYPFWYDILIAHMFGEAFLHPELTTMTRLAHEQQLAFGFSSNMRDFDLEYFSKLLDLGLSWMVISYHIPQAKQWSQTISRRYPDFPILIHNLEEKHTWSGQIDQNKKANIKKQVREAQPGKNTDCIFHRFNLVTVSAQGDIYACCLDAEGLSSQGNLLDITPQSFLQMENNIWFELCESCPLRNSEASLLQIDKQQHNYAQQIALYHQSRFSKA